MNLDQIFRVDSFACDGQFSGLGLASFDLDSKSDN